MIDAKIIEAIRLSVILVVAYIPSVTISGWFQSWVALKFGDETSARQGYLTFNPMVHISYIGLIFILMFAFGWQGGLISWGANIPINMHAIKGRMRWARIGFAFFANALMHLVQSFIGVALFVLFGALTYSFMPQRIMTSALVKSISFVLSGYMELNVVLAIVACSIVPFKLAIFYLREEHDFYVNLMVMLIMAGIVLLIRPFIGDIMSAYYTMITTLMGVRR